jgi:hypothetical protein
MGVAQQRVEGQAELERVIHWRFERLCVAGYCAYDALKLAGAFEVDLHRAIEIVERGCPSDIAVRILL